MEDGAKDSVTPRGHPPVQIVPYHQWLAIYGPISQLGKSRSWGVSLLATGFPESRSALTFQPDSEADGNEPFSQAWVTHVLRTQGGRIGFCPEGGGGVGSQGEERESGDSLR